MGLLASGEKAHDNMVNSNDLTAIEDKDAMEFANRTQSSHFTTHVTHVTTHQSFTNHFVAHELVIGISLSLLDGLACTGNSILTKKLQAEIENIFILAVYYNVTSILMSLILMFATELQDLYFPTDAKNILYFTIHSTSKLISSFTLQVALYFGSAVTCALTINANLPLNALCEYLLFRSEQPLSGGNSTELAGVIIVTIGVILCPLVELIEYCKTKRNGEKTEQKHLLEG